MLKKLIDFTKFDVDDYEDIDDNGTEYILCKTKHEDIPYYIDHEIEHSKNDQKNMLKLSDELHEFVNKISQSNEEFKKLKNTFLKKSDNYKIKYNAFYESTTCYVLFFSLNYEEEDRILSLTGIINKTTEEYLFIGCRDEHYFIHSDKFSYGDSSGEAICDIYVINPDLDFKDCTHKSNKLTSKSTVENITQSLQNHLTLLNQKNVKHLNQKNTKSIKQ